MKTMMTMRINDRNYLIALALFGNGGSHKAAKDSGRNLLIDAVEAKLKQWDANPSNPIHRMPVHEPLASMSLSFSIGASLVRRINHPSDFPQPTKPSKATAELLQRYDSRLKGWLSMKANAQRDVDLVQSLAATLGLTEVPPASEHPDVVDAVIDVVPTLESVVVVDVVPTLESVVGRSNATMLIEHPGMSLNTVQSVKDAVLNGFDLTEVDGIGPVKANQIEDLIGL